MADWKVSGELMRIHCTYQKEAALVRVDQAVEEVVHRVLGEPHHELE